MKVVVTGATGFIGSHLVRALTARGDDVTAVTRNVERGRSALPAGVSVTDWPSDAAVTSIAEADAIVNLAGEPVADKRWTADQKSRIRDSRIDSTGRVVEALKRNEKPGKVLVNGSAMGYYGARGGEVLTERSSPGSDFLAGVVAAWEDAARQAEAGGARVVMIRSGIVLGITGGALPKLLIPFKLFAGGVMGSPEQWVSWIHIDDEVGIILKAIDDPSISGPVNGTSPNPVHMKEFSLAIGTALHRPVWAPGIPMASRIVLGERAEVALASQRVEPAVALAKGYNFNHDRVGPALADLLAPEGGRA